MFPNKLFVEVKFIFLPNMYKKKVMGNFVNLGSEVEKSYFEDTFRFSGNPKLIPLDLRKTNA